MNGTLLDRRRVATLRLLADGYPLAETRVSVHDPDVVYRLGCALLNEGGPDAGLEVSIADDMASREVYPGDWPADEATFIGLWRLFVERATGVAA